MFSLLANNWCTMLWTKLDDTQISVARAGRFVPAFALCLWLSLTAFAAEQPAESGRLRVLIITGGHDFEEVPFFAMFDRMPGIAWSHARYGGDAENLLTSAATSRYDALLFYDMNQQQGPHTGAIERALAQGKPAVFLHHAIGSYPAWKEYTQLVGGHANFGGRVVPGVPNTKFLHDVWMRVQIADLRHPITSGLRDFDIYDEAYKNVGISPDVHVLLRTDYADSDRVIAWTHRYKNSRIVYLQPGHGPQAFSHPIFEALVRRSLLWTTGKLGATAP